jgi:sporulation protein YlmC with PRC-barrel domain
MRHRYLLLPAVTAFAAACAMTGQGPFTAPAGGSGGSASAPPVWQGRDLSGGWAAGRVIGTGVYSRDGEEIGRVENIVIGPDDRVRSVAILVPDASAGASEAAGRQVLVPWQDLRATLSRESFAIPVEADEVRFYPAMEEDAARAGPGPRAWRVTELIGDTVQLDDASAYGRVDDILFGADGTVQGVLVAPADAGAQAYAVPFQGFGQDFGPEAPVYALPYGTADIAGAEPFDYDVF